MLRQWKKELRRIATFRRGELRFTIVFFGWVLLSSYIGRIAAIIWLAEHIPLAAKVAVGLALYFAVWKSIQQIHKGMLLNGKVSLPRGWILACFILSIGQAAAWADLPAADLLITILLILLIISYVSFLFRNMSTNSRRDAGYDSK